MTSVEWIAIAVNLIFISFLSSMLIPGLFHGLKHTFSAQQELERKLRQKQEEQELTLRQLEIRNNEMEQFVHFASHELKEPVRMVNSFLQRFEFKYYQNLDEKGKEYIDFAADGGKRMERIIADLQEYSLAGSATVQKVRVNLEEVVKSILELLEETITATGAKVTYHNLPVLVTDYSLVENILKNLVSNAIKYHSDNYPSKVCITAWNEDNEWHISVKDNGIGMDTSDLDRIFELFSRLHDKSRYAGTGIGLAIVKKSLDLLGGGIKVESEPGKGSNFIFTLKAT